MMICGYRIKLNFVIIEKLKNFSFNQDSEYINNIGIINKNTLTDYIEIKMLEITSTIIR